MLKGQRFTYHFTVDEGVYKGFIDAFRDKNPLHTDRAFAQAKGFDAEVMHGNILNGFISFFIGECLPVKNVIIQTQEIRFYHPVYLNDKLAFEAEISDLFESVNAIEFKYFFENTNGKKVAKGKIQIGLI